MAPMLYFVILLNYYTAQNRFVNRFTTKKRCSVEVKVSAATLLFCAFLLKIPENQPDRAVIRAVNLAFYGGFLDPVPEPV